MTAILEGRNIVKTFTTRRGGQKHEVRAVGDVTVAADRGEIVGLVGESGCGKTTFSRILIGIETASSGTMLHDGKPVATKADWKALRRDVQYVFQDPYTSLCRRCGSARHWPSRCSSMASATNRSGRSACARPCRWSGCKASSPIACRPSSPAASASASAWRAR